jgi:hypothetical protein
MRWDATISRFHSYATNQDFRWYTIFKRCQSADRAKTRRHIPNMSGFVTLHRPTLVGGPRSFNFASVVYCTGVFNAHAWLRAKQVVAWRGNASHGLLTPPLLPCSILQTMTIIHHRMREGTQNQCINEEWVEENVKSTNMKVTCYKPGSKSRLPSRVSV